MAITGNQIMASAKKYTGVPYYEGNPQGVPPDAKGFDCSGIVQRALADLGVSIPRTTSLQLADATAKGLVIGTDKNKAQVGDIIHYTGHEEIWDDNKPGDKHRTVFSEAYSGGDGNGGAGIRGETPWPVIGIVRYADGGVGQAVIPGPQQGGDPGRVSGTLEDIVPGLNSLTDMVRSVIGILTSITKLFTFILDPKNWWRVALAVFGFALLMLALLRLTKTPASAVISNPEVASKVATAAGKVG